MSTSSTVPNRPARFRRLYVAGVFYSPLELQWDVAREGAPAVASRLRDRATYKEYSKYGELVLMGRCDEAAIELRRFSRELMCHLQLHYRDVYNKLREAVAGGEPIVCNAATKALDSVLPSAVAALGEALDEVLQRDLMHLLTPRPCHTTERAAMSNPQQQRHLAPRKTTWVFRDSVRRVGGFVCV